MFQVVSDRETTDIVKNKIVIYPSHLQKVQILFLLTEGRQQGTLPLLVTEFLFNLNLTPKNSYLGPFLRVACGVFLSPLVTKCVDNCIHLSYGLSAWSFWLFDPRCSLIVLFSLEARFFFSSMYFCCHNLVFLQ